MSPLNQHIVQVNNGLNYSCQYMKTQPNLLKTGTYCTQYRTAYTKYTFVLITLLYKWLFIIYTMALLEHYFSIHKSAMTLMGLPMLAFLTLKEPFG